MLEDLHHYEKFGYINPNILPLCDLIWFAIYLAYHNNPLIWSLFVIKVVLDFFRVALSSFVSFVFPSELGVERQKGLFLRIWGASLVFTWWDEIRKSLLIALLLKDGVIG